MVDWLHHASNMEILRQLRRRSLLVAEVLGTLLSFIPSVVMSFTAPHSPMMAIWITWSLGNCLVGYAAWRRGSLWILLLMTAYTVTNIAGVVHLMLS